MTAKTNILDEPNKVFDGIKLTAEWRPPAGMGYHPIWLADVSAGCGNAACHACVRLLGFEIALRIYWRTDNDR